MTPLQRTAAQLAKGWKTRMVYDALGRMTAHYEPDLESHWIYDRAPMGKGKLGEAFTGSVTRKDYRRLHTYDQHGRAGTTTQLMQEAT